MIDIISRVNDPIGAQAAVELRKEQEARERSQRLANGDNGSPKTKPTAKKARPRDDAPTSYG